MVAKGYKRSDEIPDFPGALFFGDFKKMDSSIVLTEKISSERFNVSVKVLKLSGSLLYGSMFPKQSCF